MKALDWLKEDAAVLYNHILAFSFSLPNYIASAADFKGATTLWTMNYPDILIKISFEMEWTILLIFNNSKANLRWSSYTQLSITCYYLFNHYLIT